MMTTFTLTTNIDNFVGGSANDIFKGTYNDGATGTWGILDALNGGDGIDTLSITPIGFAAITPNDSYWSHITHIEKIVINTTDPGAQTLTTGAFFQAAFAAAGVDLKTISGAGAITIDMSSFTGATVLTTLSTDGAQAITTGTGLASITASSVAGALTMTGAGLTTVKATTTGAGAQTIGDSSGGGADLVTVTANSAGGAQTITSTGSNAVTVTATSTAGVQTISTDAGADVITATTTAAINTINSGAGDDRVIVRTAASGSYTINAGAGVDLVKGGAGDDSINGGDGNDSLYGGAGNDTLTGGLGNDSLNGEVGADTLIGGDGSDGYFVDNASDVVTETNAASIGGSDTAYSYLDAYTLTANVENGRLLATGVANLTGNSLNNLLIAGVGNNILNGGTGIDTAAYTYAGAAVTVSLAVTVAQATGGSGSDTLASIENLTGSNFNDTLTGDAGANTLNGNVGADSMAGGDGHDIYYADNAGDVVTETNATASTGGLDTVYSYLGTYTLTANVENGQLLATGAANLTGNSLDNSLVVGAGDNVINGGAGIDTAVYTYAGSAVTVSLAVAAAQATGGSGSDTLAGIENLNGSNFNDTLTGDAGANSLNGGVGNDTLAGSLGNDILNGNVGADSMAGGDGHDIYFVDHAGDVVTETNATSTGGIDTVYTYLGAYTLTANVENGRLLSTGATNLTGNGLNNSLVSGLGDNVLVGGLGNDTLDGGIGADSLTGGGGNDRFDFNALSEMGVLSSTRDVINDFVQGQDKIDLSTLDANTATIANDAFTGFIASGASFTLAGQLMMSSGVLYGNTDADSAAEFAIQVTGITTLVTSDMVL